MAARLETSKHSLVCGLEEHMRITLVFGRIISFMLLTVLLTLTCVLYFVICYF